jgi:hypothetical protein
MATFKDKISSLINQQAPEFVLEQHPKFLEFIKTYYTFMESAELDVTSVQTTDGILLETETAQNNELILDGSRLDTDRTQLDAGDKILLESSAFGKFTRGETITGQTSGATTTVLTEDLDNGRLFISAQDKFIIGETILGNSSNASAIVNNYSPNPVNNIQELLNFRDPDKTISNFLTKFRNEFLNTLPENLATDVDKRNLIKNVKSLYRAKGTNRGHELFFRLLFDLESETIYPRENMLRASDGQWDTQLIMRAIQSSAQQLTGNTANLIGRTITGETSGATAIIENVFKFQIGINEVTEFILNEDTITGTFQTSEIIRGTSTDDDDIFIKATVTGIPNSTTLTNDGTLYTEGETVTLTGGGTGAIINVDSIGRSSLTNFYIDDGGSGYEIGDDIVFNNTDTGGGSARAKVSVVNGGFTQEESESTEEDHLILEDETVRGDSYTGNKVVQESGTGSGDVTDIRIINAGSNYLSLPIVTVDDTNGSGASIFTYGSEIGRILSLKTVESGAEHQLSASPPSLTLRTKLLLLDKSGDFTTSETVTGIASDSTSITATVISFDGDRNILTLSGTTGNFANNSTITGNESGSTATVKISDQATATATVGATADTAGTFLNEDGHVSETTMRIQDSLYYQDFSYVIKVGRTINDWRDSFKKTMHTGGFYFTGQVNIQTQVDAQLRSFTTTNSGIDFDGVQLVLNTLFSTIFGRRLGTTTDGTTLRANPELGVDPDFTDSTITPLDKNTRDLTLNQVITIKVPSIAKITVRGDELKYGYAYCGPRMKNINTYWRFLSGGDNPQTSTVGATGDSSITTNISPMQMANWANFRLTGLNSTDYDGELVQFGEINTPDLKTYIAFPTEIKVG